MRIMDCSSISARKRRGVQDKNEAQARRPHEPKTTRGVRDDLIGKGVPDSAITVTAYGESEQIIPTEEGVGEVQNRRVEVRF